MLATEFLYTDGVANSSQMARMLVTEQVSDDNEDLPKTTLILREKFGIASGAVVILWLSEKVYQRVNLASPPRHSVHRSSDCQEGLMLVFIVVYRSKVITAS